MPPGLNTLAGVSLFVATMRDSQRSSPMSWPIGSPISSVLKTRNAIACILALQLSFAQQPAVPAPDRIADSPVILLSTTKLVQVSVVVHNKKGEPVRDLR